MTRPSEVLHSVEKPKLHLKVIQALQEQRGSEYPAGARLVARLGGSSGADIGFGASGLGGRRTEAANRSWWFHDSCRALSQHIRWGSDPHALEANDCAANCIAVLNRREEATSGGKDVSGTGT
jgi:hypothetical protein